MKWKTCGQMSESTLVVAILCISGGFQDAYTYNCRDGVFANAQTGNMVLLGQNFATGRWQAGIRYLVPVLAFTAGIFFAEKIRRRYRGMDRIHWRQIIVLIEAILLLGVGFLGQGANLAANVLVSFVCAMQVQTFRKLNGNSYATTMCIGNLRTATDLLCSYQAVRDKKLLEKSLIYFGFIGIFMIGAAVGGVTTGLVGERAIWASCALLAAVFFLMFVKENGEES